MTGSSAARCRIRVPGLRAAVVAAVVAALLLALVPGDARAEVVDPPLAPAASGAIEGVVVNAHTGNPLVGLTLTFVRVATGARTSVTSGLGGAFRVSGLVDGDSYDVQTVIDGRTYQITSGDYLVPPIPRLTLQVVFDLSGVDGPVFRDVAYDHPFASDILWMSESNIAGGWPDGTYRPNLPVTRQAAAAFLYRLAGSPPVSGSAGFRDVPVTHPFHREITWMVSRGITTGFPDNTFRPNETVTRQAAAAFFHRYAGRPPVWNAAGFRDVPRTHPFHDEIAWMVSQGLTTGWPDNTFRPGQQVTRQSMAAFTYRYVNGGVG